MSGIGPPQVPEVIKVHSPTLEFVVKALLDHAAQFEQKIPIVQKGTDRVALGAVVNVLRQSAVAFAALADDVRNRRRPGWEDVAAPPLIVVP